MMGHHFEGSVTVTRRAFGYERAEEIEGLVCPGKKNFDFRTPMCLRKHGEVSVTGIIQPLLPS